MLVSFCRFLLLALLAISASASAAPNEEQKAQTVLHLLDYVGVDYPEFVRDGKVLDEAEYQEQKEFAKQSTALIAQLPAQAQREATLAKAQRLLHRIESKAPGVEVSALAAEVRRDVIRGWNVVVAPRQAPDVRRAATLYQAQCAACHGAQGKGDGPLGKGLDPAPSDFLEAARMDQRSVFGLYNTITLGVAGTGMRPYAELSDSDRWALAFFAASLRTPPHEVERGRATWEAGKGREPFSDLQSLVMPAPLQTRSSGPDSEAVYAFLVAQPEALAALRPSPIAFARDKVRDAVQAAGQGDHDAARQHAITAYLEGFELVEAALDNVDGDLRQQIERQMMVLRDRIGSRAPQGEVAAAGRQVTELLDAAEDRLGGDGLSPTSAFLASLVILLREGLEAILVLAAIGAFVVKTGRRDALPYIHAGRIGAVVLGAVTWWVASSVITISGANREITEGITALLAAAMLLYVGWWLHARSYAQAWTAFLRERVSAALGRRTLWAMATVSFLAVYRELFEIVLFYQTLFAQVGAAGHSAVLWGMAVAACVLVVVGALVLRYSVRLPIGPFFATTSGLLAVLAVVFIGHGVATLQEAGALAATLLDFRPVPLLGIHPTAQGLTAQAVGFVLVAFGLLANHRKGAKAG